MSYKDPVKQREYQRLWRRNRAIIEKNQALDILGGKCIICDISDYRVLQIDHIEPILRKVNSYSGSRLKQMICNGSTDISKLQLLCANCHQIKTLEDRCKYGNWIN